MGSALLKLGPASFPPFSQAGVWEDPTQLHYASRHVQKQTWLVSHDVCQGLGTAPLTMSSIHRFRSYISPHRPVGCLSHLAHRQHEPDVDCRGIIGGGGRSLLQAEAQLGWWRPSRNKQLLKAKRYPTPKKQPPVCHFAISLLFVDTTSTSTGSIDGPTNRRHNLDPDEASFRHTASEIT